MTKQTFGAAISALRKEKGMTQLELARQMGVTDKAVSKWERDLSFPDVASLPKDLSFPDVASLPKLAETLGTSVDELLEVKTTAQEKPAPSKVPALAELVLKAVALAMGVGVTALTIMDEVEPRNALGLLGIGVACLALVQLMHTDNEQS